MEKSSISPYSPKNSSIDEEKLKDSESTMQRTIRALWMTTIALMPLLRTRCEGKATGRPPEIDEPRHGQVKKAHQPKPPRKKAKTQTD